MAEKRYEWLDGATLEEHSRRKHKILREYFHRYLVVRCQVPQATRFPYPGNVTIDAPTGRMRLGGVMLRVALWWESEPVWQSAATMVSYGSRADIGHHRVEFSSAQSRDDWAISLQAQARATEIGDLKPGGVWPDRNDKGKKDPRAAPIDLA